MKFKSQLISGILFFATIFISGCVGTGNVVKILNRVRCNPSTSYCSQEMINDLWDYCLQNGYTTNRPNGKVKSAREISELVKDSFMKNKSTKKTEEYVSEKGIVYNKEILVDNEVKVSVDGYCMGSEYILN